MANDVLDILDIEESSSRKPLLDTKALLNRSDKKKSVVRPQHIKRPEHIPREVWGLQNTFQNELPPLLPSDESPVYKQPKVVFGSSRVRRWEWVPFKNSARKDDLQLYHWRREDTDPNEEYHFARLNKHMEVPTYTDSDYKAYLLDSAWPRDRTDHLVELARLYDVRFIHMHDRWDAEKFPPRPTLEDMKDRYYGILATLDKIRGTELSQGLRYDADHERQRKQQLSLLYGRSRDEVEEEERLIAELERIEARRSQREKLKDDVQRIMKLQVDPVTGATEGGGGGEELPSGSRRHSTASGGALGGGAERRRSTAGGEATGSGRASASVGATLAGTVSAINNALSTRATSLPIPDLSKTPGVHLSSQRMKIPSSLGQKKLRVIENFLGHFQMDPCPPATKEVVEEYNDLRANILLLYDVRAVTLNCDYDLQSARARLEAFAPDRLPADLVSLTGSSNSAIPAGVDLGVVQALKAADAKRIQGTTRHAFGHAGSLRAAEGTFASSSCATATGVSGGGGGSPHSSLDESVVSGGGGGGGVGGGEGGGGGGGAPQRKKRAAAAEQGKVMKKLKSRGHLVE